MTSQNKQTSLSGSTWPPLAQMADTTSRHYLAKCSGSFGGHPLQYTAELSEMLVKSHDGTPATSMFLTSFLADVAPPVLARRAVIFLFNGGPGGASNTLMFGAFGPERLKRFDSPALSDPSIARVANGDTILDAADLIFIDAPETGMGRPLPGSDPGTFRSVDGDSFAFGQAILRWLSDHGRLSSPIYLAGESYGSIRAVLLTRDLLAATPRVAVAGLVLISQALTYNGPESSSIRRLPDPLRDISRLPDIVALSWHHGLIDNHKQSLDEAIQTARAFSLGEYAHARIAGNRLPDTQRQSVAGRLAALTGLPAELWLSHNLRLDNPRRQLLAHRNLALCQFDGRETEPLIDVPEDEDRDFPSMVRGLTTATEQFISEIFHATGLPEYRSIIPDPYAFEKTWEYIMPPASGADTVLKEHIAANPELRIMVAQGIFDTTTFMGDADSLFSQISARQTRLSLVHYVGGHMLYSDDTTRRQFLDDVRAFVSGRPIDRHALPGSY